MAPARSRQVHGAFPQYGRQAAKGGPAGASKSPGSGPPPRQRKYLPILFDFEKPKSRNTDQTITLLARMARFVVADKGGVPGGVGGGAGSPLPEKADEKCSGRLCVLMTHLCHKRVGGGTEIPQCSSLSAAPSGVVSFGPSTEG